MSNSHDSNIIISTGTIVRFFLIAILLGAMYFMSDVVMVIITAIVIASALDPIIRRLVRYKINRIIAVILVYIIIAVLLFELFIFFIPLVLNDAVTFLAGLPKSISVQSLWSPISMLSGQASNAVLSEHSILISDVVNNLRSLIVGTSTGAFETASKIFGGFFSFIIIMVLSFYLAMKTDGVGEFLRIVAPVRHHDYIINLWKRSQRKMALWLQGQVVLGLIVGVLVYLVLVIANVPHALVLAVIAGLLEIIPVFGPIIASIPAIILAFSYQGVGTGIVVMILYFIIHQLESQVFYPLVVKKVVGMSPILVIIALVVGAKLVGILGALIAVPLAAAFMEYINDVEKDKKAEVEDRVINNKIDFN
jgi:predicted PurR-regulated permease PerM